MSDELDQLFAAHVPDPDFGGGRLRWDIAEQRWRGTRSDQPLGHVIGIDAAEVLLRHNVKALQGLALQIASEPCLRCGTCELEMHAIVPDPLRRPGRVCLQVPDPFVVQSSVSGDRWKHDASTICDRIAGGPSADEAVIWSRGRPATASEAIGLDWCPTCVTSAGNTHSAIAVALRYQLARRPTQAEIQLIEADRRKAFVAEELWTVAYDFVSEWAVERPAMRNAQPPNYERVHPPSIEELVGVRYGRRG